MYSQQSRVAKKSPGEISVNLQSIEGLISLLDNQELVTSLTHSIGFAFLLRMFYSFSVV